MARTKGPLRFSLPLLDVAPQRFCVGERHAPRRGPCPQAHSQPYRPPDLAQVVFESLGLSMVAEAEAQFFAHGLKVFPRQPVAVPSRPTAVSDVSAAAVPYAYPARASRR